MWKIRQIWRTWLPLVSIVFLIVVVCVWVKISLCEANKLSQICAYAGGFIAGMVALSTYLKNSSIKRMEFIDQVYKELDEDKDIVGLYDLLIEDKNLKIPPKSQNEPALIKALTLFDRIINYYEQNLINKETLSYIAAEILDFYNHRGVIDYINDIHKKYEYDRKGYEKDIRFYSGLLELGKICSEEYLMKGSKKH
jgi:hypothetical protein